MLKFLHHARHNVRRSRAQFNDFFKTIEYTSFKKSLKFKALRAIFTILFFCVVILADKICKSRDLEFIDQLKSELL